jgi:two-component system sensor histidine kinase YesM
MRNTIIKQNNKLTHTVINGKKLLQALSISQNLNVAIIKYVAVDELLQGLNKYQKWFWFFTVIALFMIIIYSVITYRIIQKPLTLMVQAFRKVESGDLTIAIKHQNKDEYGYLYFRFNAMVETIMNLIDQVYKQKILAQKAELKQLQSQINPHFLYNSFFILHRMISWEDFDNAVKFSNQLGGYFQFLTRNTADQVTLSKEVSHARVYAEIQTMRFSHRMQMVFDQLPELFADMMVPRLILQPILENAFEHGLEHKEKNGLLRVSFLHEGNQLRIVIEDNGDGVDDTTITSLSKALVEDATSTEMTGILNVHKRIQLTLGEEYGVSLDRSDLGGLRVTIILVGGTHV